ncbi:beta-ketoacyl synthase N-terminal-like domain-containing protein [Streptomyces sp. NPDC006512]|uniref:type I polyketide synthase n=1 Tax=Streptomyces sp. NPDC006512 TaxID=3154307 RepID=UPI0033AD9E65
MDEPVEHDYDADPPIAVIGMAARFPGADTVEEFWENLDAGREAVRPVTDEEFLAAGGDPADLADPLLVRMASTVRDIDRFDSAFFGYSPAEAETVDPQQRLLLECAYHALEDSGYAAGQGDSLVGVYAGATDSRYYASHVHPKYAGRGGSLPLVHAATNNSLGTLATRISYELGLTGPSLSLQTACSTALVALHQACQDLIDHKCDMALSGAVSLNPSALLGYQHVPDGPFSPDGRCRAFAAGAAGTSSGDGVGVVVLKRLDDALADGDRIRAVIRGSAINNDGRRKVGFTAPSTEGQTEVILAAHAAAGVPADSITYVEAHGTATRIGDPLEVHALTEAFRQSTDRRGYCALGSVKTNIGHLGAAAGIAGFIKTVLALEHRRIPPNLHFDAPNPLIDFDSSPFRVPTEAQDWPADATPRRAGISAFGVGGTNAHVILEEAPAPAAPAAAPPAHAAPHPVLTLSARTPAALRGQREALARHLDARPGAPLADTAHALRAHRPAMPYRATVSALTPAEAVRALRAPAPDAVAVPAGGAPEVAFLLPGGGTQYVGMGAGLYRDHATFRDVVDRCADILRPVIGGDIRTALYRHTDPGSVEAFLSLVVTEYALAETLIRHGVRPAALTGHSLGEYTAACLAGVLTLEEMLPLVALRLRLITSVGGATVSVALGEEALRPHLGDGLSLAAVNGPEACTVAGTGEQVAAFEARLEAAGVFHRRVRMPAAAHSHVLDPVLDAYAEALHRVELRAPRIPYVTNVTGTWVTDAQATSVRHWIDHTRRTVRFADGVRTLTEHGVRVYAEIGPGDVLSKLVRAGAGPRTPLTVPTLRHAKAATADGQVLADALGTLWSAGAEVDFTPGTVHAPSHRVSLPGYAFERTRHWIDAPGAVPRADDAPGESPAPADRARAPRPYLATPHVAPRTERERRVARHWEAALGIEGVGIHDNYFDLGGDSLAGVVLTARMRAAGALDVPAAALMTAPTIAGLLAAAGAEDCAAPGAGTDAFAPVLALRPDGDQRPLFCVHPGAGVAWRYSGLLTHLGARQPVYGIQAHGLAPGTEPAADAAEMVASYVGHLREIQPHGPYRLLGWSYGGVVAHAMATALQRQGEQVELLALMDPPLPQGMALSAEDGERQVAGLLLRVAGLTPPEDGAPDLAGALRLLREHEETGGGTLPVTAHQAATIARVMLNSLRIAPGFAPGAFRGDVLFFTAAGDPAGPGGPGDAMGRTDEWARYVDGAIVEHPVPAGHYEMTEPRPLAVVGAALAEALRTSATDPATVSRTP